MQYHSMPKRATCRETVLSNGFNGGIELASPFRSRMRRLFILLNVEPPQQHNGFFSIQPSVTWVGRINARIGVNGEHASSATKSLITATIINTSNAVLP